MPQKVVLVTSYIKVDGSLNITASTVTDVDLRNMATKCPRQALHLLMVVLASASSQVYLVNAGFEALLETSSLGMVSSRFPVTALRSALLLSGRTSQGNRSCSSRPCMPAMMQVSCPTDSKTRLHRCCSCSIQLFQ